MNIANLKKRILRFAVAVALMGAAVEVSHAQSSNGEVEAHNGFGSGFGNNGGANDPGSGTQPQPSPTPETFQAAFEIGSSGKQIKQDCAVCHWLEVHVDGRKLQYGETVTLSKDKTHEVTVTDMPQTRGTPPAGATPPHDDTQTFTVYPKAVGNQTITEIPGSAGDPPQGFIVNSDSVAEYLIDNSQKLLAQNKEWPKNAADEPMNKKAKLISVKLITPAGDPVNSPVEAGTDIANIPDGANEFTYSSATTGVLTIKLKAKVEGIGGMSQNFQDKFKFEVDAVGESTMAWETGNENGKATVNGDFLEAKVTFTGLPENNSDFGKKKARVVVDGQKAEEKEFEVFFPAYEKNHPNDIGDEPESMNWYHYWKQTSAGGSRNYRYDNSIQNSGQTDHSSSGWRVRISSVACKEGIPGAGLPGGIDYFAWIVRHEAKHLSQFSAFWGSGDRIVADDPDGDFVPTANEPTYLLGRPFAPNIFATYLDTIGYYPYAGTAIPDCEDICMRSQSSPTQLDILWTNGSANSADWANPGKQHQTLGKWND
jgi:hypothetical protein